MYRFAVQATAPPYKAPRFSWSKKGQVPPGVSFFVARKRPGMAKGERIGGNVGCATRRNRQTHHGPV